MNRESERKAIFEAAAKRRAEVLAQVEQLDADRRAVIAHLEEHRQLEAEASRLAGQRRLISATEQEATGRDEQRLIDLADPKLKLSLPLAAAPPAVPYCHRGDICDRCRVVG